MKTVEEQYHLVADGKLKGSYYVSYTSVGGGCYEFVLTKSPHKFYSSLQEITPMRELLERTIKNDGVYDNNNFIYIDSEMLEEIGGIVNVNIQKSVITKEVEISYID